MLRRTTTLSRFLPKARICCSRFKLMCTRVQNNDDENIISPLMKYNELVEAKQIRDDTFQRSIVAHLDDLHERCKNYTPPIAIKAAEPVGFFAKFFAGIDDGEQKKEREEDIDILESEAPKGIYLHGDVGTGKSFLMDLFFDTCTFTKKKRRVHFHSFMLDVHEKIHEIRKTTATKENNFRCPDPIKPLAKQLAEDAWLLCFDEFQVTDIADAMILHRLFTRLFQYGVVLVTTSNRVPDDLYLGGLQRVLFIPFIDLLKIKVSTLNLDSGVDYRLTGTMSATVFHSPLNEKTEESIRNLFKTLTKNNPTEEKIITHQNRKIYVPECTENGVARFGFADLCMKPMGAGDYNIICKNFHTVFVCNIPQMSLSEKTEAKRFIILIDTMYESKTKLICSAEVTPEELFTHDPTQLQQDNATKELLDFLHEDGVTMFTGQEEVFQFARAVSRLREMQTEEYLAANRSHTLE